MSASISSQINLEFILAIPSQKGESSLDNLTVKRRKTTSTRVHKLQPLKENFAVSFCVPVTLILCILTVTDVSRLLDSIVQRRGELDNVTKTVRHFVKKVHETG